MHSPLLTTQQKSSLKKRDIFESASAEKKKNKFISPPKLKAQELDKSIEVTKQDSCMGESLPRPKMRNAVSFVDRPKMSKTKSLRPSKANKTSALFPSEQVEHSMPANNQDDEDFDRAESDDSDDYDGVPQTEEIPQIAPVQPLDRDKMEITLDRTSNSNEPDIQELPITQTVEDS